jgi:uncharacterized Zn finger protein
MAPSKCPGCGSERFAIRELDSQDLNPKLTVQCAACGVVVRVLNYGAVNLSELTQRLGYRRPTA